MQDVNQSSEKINLIKNVDGPVGKNLVVFIKFNETDKLNILKLTADLCKRKMEHFNHFDSQRKIR